MSKSSSRIAAQLRQAFASTSLEQVAADGVVTPDAPADAPTAAELESGGQVIETPVEPASAPEVPAIVEAAAVIDPIPDATPADAPVANAADAAAVVEEAAVVEDAPVTDVVVTEEGIAGAVVGGLVGAATLSPIGVAAGAAAGHFIQKGLSKTDAEKAAEKAAVVSKEGEGDEVIVSDATLEPVVDEAPAVLETPVADAIVADAPAADIIVADAAVVDAPVADAVVETPIADATIAVDGATADEVIDTVPADAAAPEAVIEEAPLSDAVTDAEAPALVLPESEGSDVQLIEAEEEVETAQDAVAEMTAVAEGLEAIAASMEATINDGGLTLQAAEFCGLAVESHLSRIGIDQPVMLSLENFGGATARARATTASLEGIQETIAKIWAAIKATIIKLTAFIKSFLAQVLASSNRMRAAAMKTQEAAEARKTYKRDEKARIDLSVLGQKLAIGTRVDVSDLSNVAAVLTDALSHDDEASAELQADYEIIKTFASKKMEGGSSAFINAVSKEMGKRKPKPKRAFMLSFTEGSTEGFKTEVLPGNVVLSFQHEVADENGDQTSVSAFLRNYFGGWRTVRDTVESKLPEKFEAPVLLVRDVQEICKVSLEIADLAEKAEKQARADSLSFADLKIVDDASEEQKRFIAQLISQFSKRVALSNQATAKVAGYAVQTAGAYLQYAQKSLAHYA